MLGARESRLTVTEAETQLARRRDTRAGTEEVASLCEELDLPKRGDSEAAARSLAVLAEHGLEAVGLMDTVEIAYDHRGPGDARLVLLGRRGLGEMPSIRSTASWCSIPPLTSTSPASRRGAEVERSNSAQA